MKNHYRKPEVSELGHASVETKSRELTNADDTNLPNSANPLGKDLETS
jgi:hypothetical protein